jgi:hypothetical protein
MQFKSDGVHAVALALAGCALSFIPSASAYAQNAEMTQKLQEVKAASAANKAALAHYTWQEQQVISLKGNVKKSEVYQVSVGPDGEQQKTELSSSPAPAPPSGGRLKQRIVEKKTDEFQQYGQQVAALAKQYAHLDPQLLQEAYQQGNISLQMGGGAGTTSLVIKNYLKPNDQMTLVFNSAEKAIAGMNVSSYLSGPSDVVTMSVQFAMLPSGVNHVASTQINGVSKQMTVAITNSNYQMGQM